MGTEKVSEVKNIKECRIIADPDAVRDHIRL
jgi:hypothetical protein